MSWLRPAVLYLTLTALIGGSIWLFWGKALEQKWKQLSLETAKPDVTKSRPAAKKIPLKPDLKKEQTELVKTSPREEWQKTQSGMIALVAIEAADNRSQLMKLSAFNDNRWYELLRRPKPAAAMPVEKQPAHPEHAKPADRQLAKPEGLRPSKQKVK